MSIIGIVAGSSSRTRSNFVKLGRKSWSEAKTPLALVPPVSTLDTVVGVRDDGTGAQIVQLTTSNLAALLQIDAGGLVRPLWTELATIVGSYDGQPARVLGDAGHHNDPVTAGHPHNVISR